LFEEQSNVDLLLLLEVHHTWANSQIPAIIIWVDETGTGGRKFTDLSYIFPFVG